MLYTARTPYLLLLILFKEGGEVMIVGFVPSFKSYEGEEGDVMSGQSAALLSDMVR